MRLRPALVLCAAVLVVLAGCSKGSDQPDAKSTAKASHLLPTDAPSSPTASPATGSRIDGTGYTLTLPADWTDITKVAKSSQPKIDAAGRATKATAPYTANLNVLTSKSTVTQSPPTRAQLETLAKQTRQEILTIVPKVVTLGLTTLGGTPAVHQEGDAQYGNKPFYIVQFATIHDGANYILTFSFPTGVDEKARAAVIDPVLSSFAFDS